MKQAIKAGFLVLSIFTITINCVGQEINNAQIDSTFFKIFSKQQYIDDLDELANILTTTHPHPYAFTSKEEFWKTVSEAKSKITDSTTFSEFLWHCSPIIAKLGCSHSSLGYFNQEDRILPISLRFPVEALFIDNRLYISDPLINAGKVKAGTEIFSINGISVSEIQKDIYKHIPAQAKLESFKRILLNGFFTAYIPYALGFPKSYEILIKHTEQPIALTPLKSYTYKPRIHPENECLDNLCLQFVEEKHIGVLTIRNFAYYGDRFPIFKTFIDNSFNEILSRGIQDLIIDLRMNNGGPSYAGAYFLRHIFSKPFTYFAQDSDFNDDLKKSLQPLPARFEGNIYLLMDGEGSSTTGHVISLIAQKNRATLIGEPLGSNHFCTANQQYGLKLTHTGVSFSVARNTFFTSVEGLAKDRPILPDHHVVQSIQDILENRDIAMEYAIRLIEEN